MDARNQILERLRKLLGRPDLRFPPPETEPLRPGEHLAITQAQGDRWELAQRFLAELRALHGDGELVETPAEARLAAIARLTAWVEEERAIRHTEPDTSMPGERDVLSWAPQELPVEGLAPALEDLGFRLVVPQDLHRPDERDTLRPIRAGLTGVDAAFASTGSMLLGSGPGRSRVASLTPYRHLALVPLSRLYPNVETWLREQREAGTLEAVLRQGSQTVLVTGPSKSADIEGNLTLGVHGPKLVYAILFDDIHALIQEG